MNIPSACPVCNGPLNHNYYKDGPPNGAQKAMVHIECLKTTTHGLRFVADEDATEAKELVLTLSVEPLLRARWDFKDKTIIVIPGTLEEIMKNRLDEKPTHIPYFEPDLSDYKKLVFKMKTYLVFS